MGDLKTEGKHAGEHLVWEANPQHCRDSAVIASGNKLDVGAVVGKVTASGKYVGFSPAATDGSEVPAGLLYDAVDATLADENGVVSSRTSTASSGEVTWPTGITVAEQTAAIAELAKIGIVLR